MKRLKRAQDTYIAARYKQKAEKYHQKENIKFKYKEKESKKPGICPNCGKYYQNEYIFRF
jgi:hypothetical protein